MVFLKYPSHYRGSKFNIARILYFLFLEWYAVNECSFCDRYRKILFPRQDNFSKMSERPTKAGNQEYCKTYKTSKTCTLSFTPSGHDEQLLFSCLCSKVTLTLYHSHTLSISHSLTLDMLNNFCFHLYCLQPKIAMFLAGNQLYDWQTHRIGCVAR